jgi:outer membrane protein TolC
MTAFERSVSAMPTAHILSVQEVKRSVLSGDVVLVSHQQLESEEPADPSLASSANSLIATNDSTQEVAEKDELLSLDDAVLIALRDNPRLRQLSARASAARASSDVAFAPFLPEFGTSFRYSGFSTPVLPGGSFVPASLSTGVTSFMIAEAGVQYTITDFGRRSGRYGQSVHRAVIEELALDRARQTIAFEVMQNYFHLLSAQANLLVADEAMRDAERILHDTKARKAGGVAERESVLRAEVELSQTKQLHLSAIQGVSDAKSVLNVTLGRSAERPISVASVTSEPTLAQTLEDALGRAIAERREIQMAREAVAGARDGVTAAKGEMLPKVYVRGTVLRAASPGPLNGDIEGAGIHVDQPIYAGGRYRAEVRRHQSDVAEAFAGLESIVDQVSLQVCVAYQAIDTERQRIQLGRVTIEQAKENLRLTRVRYDNGDATPTDIVDAQTSLRQAETTYYNAIYGYLEGLAKLEYAVGGDQSHLLDQLRSTKSVNEDFLLKTLPAESSILTSDQPATIE